MALDKGGSTTKPPNLGIVKDCSIYSETTKNTNPETNLNYLSVRLIHKTIRVSDVWGHVLFHLTLMRAVCFHYAPVPPIGRLVVCSAVLGTW